MVVQVARLVYVACLEGDLQAAAAHPICEASRRESVNTTLSLSGTHRGPAAAHSGASSIRRVRAGARGCGRVRAGAGGCGRVALMHARMHSSRAVGRVRTGHGVHVDATIHFFGCGAPIA